jgi:anthranilate phosphoribosyltransferase
MQQHGYQHGIAVQGPEGALDVLTTRRTPLMEFNAADALQSWTIDPAEYGGWGQDERFEMDVTPQTCATFTRHIIDPHSSTRELDTFRRGALLTAALMIYASGLATTFADGFNRAHAALTSGAAAQRLAHWQQVSTHTPASYREVNHA